MVTLFNLHKKKHKKENKSCMPPAFTMTACLKKTFVTDLYLSRSYLFILLILNHPYARDSSK